MAIEYGRLAAGAAGIAIAIVAGPGTGPNTTFGRGQTALDQRRARSFPWDAR
jgi:hypothetical protein